MAEQVRTTAKRSGDSSSRAEEVGPNPATVEKGEKLKGDMDKLLDEIDNVLVENAEKFVRSYVQRGGE